MSDRHAESLSSAPLPADGATAARNWIGPVGAHGADLLFQLLGYAAFLLPVGLVTEGLGRVSITVDGMISLFYMSTFAGFLGFAMYYWLVRHMTATRLSLTSFITPGVAVVTGLIVLSEPVTPALIAGLALVAVGIVIVNQWGEGEIVARQPVP